jgi:hypothetical protein
VEAVKSIREYTDCPYKITVVDNHSDPEAHSDLKAKLPDDVEVVMNDRPSPSVASGRNKVWSLVDSEYFVLLHPDMRVTKGWLSNLLEALKMGEKEHFKPCAITPLSAPYLLSKTQPPSLQSDDEELYCRYKAHFAVNSLDAMQAYCDKHGIPYKDGVIHCEPVYPPFIANGEQLMMFAASKRFRDTVGEWDERYDGSNYDDVDMALMAITKGCEVLQSTNVYVQHLQSLTNGYGNLIKNNGEKFIEKWHLTPPIGSTDLFAKLRKEHQ